MKTTEFRQLPIIAAISIAIVISALLVNQWVVHAAVPAPFTAQNGVVARGYLLITNNGVLLPVFVMGDPGTDDGNFTLHGVGLATLDFQFNNHLLLQANTSLKGFTSDGRLELFETSGGNTTIFKLGGASFPGSVTNGVNLYNRSGFVVSKAYYTVTNTWSGPTNVIDLSVGRVYLTSPTACSITGVTGKSDQGAAQPVVLKILNSSATNWLMTLGANIIGRGRANQFTVTNGTYGVFSIDWDGQTTNVAYSPF
jgi:hypothetical protein